MGNFCSSNSTQQQNMPVTGAPVNFQRRRRVSVSAETSAATADTSYEKKVIAKSEEAKNRIRNSIKDCFLFQGLTEDQEKEIIDAMAEKQVSKGEVIIEEGKDGDYFYIIEEGNFSALKKGTVVYTYEEKGSFGELALMYNCPRAATVAANSNGILWAVDRLTFRNIIVLSTMEKQKQYEATLSSMVLFKTLSEEERSIIADCLLRETVQPGDKIIGEGDDLKENAKFYIIESGNVDCMKVVDGVDTLVKSLKEGEYFGEVALVDKTTRQASCVAKDKVVCLSMGRDAFERLMGPVEEALGSTIEEYKSYNASLGL